MTPITDRRRLGATTAVRPLGGLVGDSGSAAEAGPTLLAAVELASPAAAPSVPAAPSLPALPGATADLRETATSPVWLAAKRTFDICFSLVALAVAAPVLAAVALAIKLESRGPVFYRTRRVGYRGATLMMHKFRKMHHDAAGSPLTAKADARFTRVGSFLTASRLDELPQLWDVLRGRMSVIGPRPEDPRFVALHPHEYREILTVRPGMLGLSQLAYEAEKHILCDERPVEDYIGRIMPQKLILDRLYARQTSARMDLSVIRWALVALILRRPVAVSRQTGEMNVRRRRAATQTRV